MSKQKRSDEFIHIDDDSVLLKQMDVPEYLLSSPFYENLDWSEKDAVVSVPDNCCKSNVDVSNLADAMFLLETLRYWGMPELPDSVVVFCIQHHGLVEEVTKFVANFPELKLFSASLTLKEAFREAIRMKNMRLMQLFMNYGFVCEEDDGRLAVELDVTDLLHALLSEPQAVTVPGQEWTEIAARNGSLKCLELFMEKREMLVIDLENLWLCGIECNNISVLQLLHDSKAGLDSDKCAEKFTRAAAQAGKEDILAFLRSKGLLWRDPEVCRLAVEHGHRECLKYLHENGVPWNTDCFKWAAWKEHLPILQYLHKQGAPYDIWTMKYVAVSPTVRCLQYLHELSAKVAEYAAESAQRFGTPDCLNYLIDHGCPLSKEVPQALVGETFQKDSHSLLWKLYRANCPAPKQGTAAAHYFGLFDYLTMGTAFDSSIGVHKRDGLPVSLLSQVEEE